MRLVDSHCHLDLLDLDTAGIDQVVKRAEDNGVTFLLNVSVSLDDFPTVLKTAERYSHVVASVGMHPNEQGEEVSIDTLVNLGRPAKVVAVGETGLDYFRSTGDLTWQQNRFRTHIQAAKLLNKPLIVHTRDAKDDTINIMKEQNASDIGGVMHCFTEDWAVAKEALDLGFYISFSGIVTFKNASIIQDTASRVPLDRILVETDAPYLAPAPHRGKKNEPAYVRYTAEYLAELKKVTLDEFAEQTTKNFFTLFKGAKRIHV